MSRLPALAAAVQDSICQTLAFYRALHLVFFLKQTTVSQNSPKIVAIQQMSEEYHDMGTVRWESCSRMFRVDAFPLIPGCCCLFCFFCLGWVGFFPCKIKQVSSHERSSGFHIRALFFFPQTGTTRFVHFTTQIALK